MLIWGWEFSSVVERLPSKRKALGSVHSSGKKEKEKKNVDLYPFLCYNNDFLWPEHLDCQVVLIS